jgi:fumarate reductase iron-sulfur subunit
VDPAHAINQNKVNSTADYFGVLKLMMPKGSTE